MIRIKIRIQIRIKIRIQIRIQIRIRSLNHCAQEDKAWASMISMILEVDQDCAINRRYYQTPFLKGANNVMA